MHKQRRQLDRDRELAAQAQRKAILQLEQEKKWQQAFALEEEKRKVLIEFELKEEEKRKQKIEDDKRATELAKERAKQEEAKASQKAAENKKALAEKAALRTGMYFCVCVMLTMCAVFDALNDTCSLDALCSLCLQR